MEYNLMEKSSIKSYVLVFRRKKRNRNVKKILGRRIVMDSNFKKDWVTWQIWEMKEGQYPWTLPIEGEGD